MKDAPKLSDYVFIQKASGRTVNKLTWAVMVNDGFPSQVAVCRTKAIARRIELRICAAMCAYTEDVLKRTNDDS